MFPELKSACGLQLSYVFSMPPKKWLSGHGIILCILMSHACRFTLLAHFRSVLHSVQASALQRQDAFSVHYCHPVWAGGYCTLELAFMRPSQRQNAFRPVLYIKTWLVLIEQTHTRTTAGTTPGPLTPPAWVRRSGYQILPCCRLCLHGPGS